MWQEGRMWGHIVFAMPDSAPHLRISLKHLTQCPELICARKNRPRNHPEAAHVISVKYQALKIKPCRLNRERT